MTRLLRGDPRHGTEVRRAWTVNPCSVILSGVMMFDDLEWEDAARLIVAGSTCNQSRPSRMTSRARCPDRPRSARSAFADAIITGMKESHALSPPVRTASIPGRPALVVALAKATKLDDALGELDDALGVRSPSDRRGFRATRDEQCTSWRSKGPAAGFFGGYGTVAEAPVAIRRAAMIAARFARRTGAREFAWYHGDGAGTIENAVVGSRLGAWEYKETKTPLPEDERRPSPDGRSSSRTTRRRKALAGEWHAIARG